MKFWQKLSELFAETFLQLHFIISLIFSHFATVVCFPPSPFLSSSSPIEEFVSTFTLLELSSCRLFVRTLGTFVWNFSLLLTTYLLTPLLPYFSPFSWFQVFHSKFYDFPIKIGKLLHRLLNSWPPPAAVSFILATFHHFAGPNFPPLRFQVKHFAFMLITFTFRSILFTFFALLLPLSTIFQLAALLHFTFGFFNLK
jgi:hypothetical protein